MYKELNKINGFENCKDYLIYDDGRLYDKGARKFLKPLKDSNGYFYYDFRKFNAKYSCPKVHKLVMLAFSKENPQEQINHIDGNKNNNHIDNLEWCDNDYNRKHAIKFILKNEIDFGIAQYDLNNNLLNIWHTAADAMEWLGKDRRSGGQIGRVIRGKRNTYLGYKWEQYKDYDYKHPEKYQNQTLSK